MARPLWPGPWVADAACRDLPSELFFGRDRAPVERWAPRAKAICAGCPVRAECLIFALQTGQEDGVWGGTDPVERMAVRRRAVG